MNYVQPKSLDEALGLLATEQWSILAGGTDFYPGLLERPPVPHVMDLHALQEIKQITRSATHIRIGAGVTWSQIIASDLPDAFDALKLAAREVGSVQIQNRATLVGNLCNASPAADGVPPLLVLDAAVELISVSGSRQIPLQDFILGNRHTARQPDEIVSAVLVPNSATNGQSDFVKLGARKYLIISITMLALRLATDEQGIISEAAISVGSCSLVACRLAQLEETLLGQSLQSDIADQVIAEHLACLSPIDDVRSSAHYRRQASLELLKRSLERIQQTMA